MKRAPVTMGLVALALLLVSSGAEAQGDITITWVGPEQTLGTGYLPKVASDGENNVVTIDQINEGTRAHPKSPPNGISAFQFQIGALPGTAGDGVSWAGAFEDLLSPPKHAQIGLAPSIAMVFETGGPECDTAIEVHQGGQDNDGSLWYQLGSNCVPFSDISWLQSNRLEFTGLLPISKRGERNVTGYHATVAADLNSPQSEESPTTTVIEVHQEAEGESTLAYEVGVLALGSSPSISWSGTTEMMTPSFPTVQGSVPTVSVSNSLAVLVFEGTGAALFYSIGVVDTISSAITWTDPVMYDTGYNPTVSVYEHFGIINKGPVLVEAHQVNNGYGALVYSAGVVTGAASPSIKWSTSVDNPYSMGCYPSVALSFDGLTPPNANGSTSNVSVTETHESDCGTAATVEAQFGFLVQIPGS